MTRPWTPRTAFTIAVLLAAAAADAATIVRGPYLQQPTPASMIVRRRTDVATDSRVRYGAAPGSLTATADDASLTTEHVVTVSALAPDTVYFYAIGSTSADLEGDDPDHFFRTAPVPGTVRPTRIWVTGDGGYANADGMAVRDAYAAYSAGHPKSPRAGAAQDGGGAVAALLARDGAEGRRRPRRPASG